MPKTLVIPIFILLTITSCHVEHQVSSTLKDRQMQTVKSFIIDVTGLNMSKLQDLYFSDSEYESEKRKFDNDFNLINCYIKNYGLEDAKKMAI